MTENPQRKGTSTIFMNMIGGESLRASSEELFEDVNPADIRDSIGQFQSSSKDDVRNAIDRAAEAQKRWAETPAPARGKILLKVADLIESRSEELARTLTREEGKTVKESKGEITRSIDLFRFYAGLGSRSNGKTIPTEDSNQLVYTMRVPLGVVSVVTPWNFPLVIPSWKIAPALVSGNAVVFKPASLTPLIGLKLVELIHAAGIPKGVLNFVTGSGALVGGAMIENVKVAAVSFTGSVAVGNQISDVVRTAKRRPRVQLEMGGKNPTIVLRDADLDKAVSLVSTSAFGVTGQACTATSRAIVEESVHDDFVKKLVERAKSVKVGNGLEASTEMGPAVSQAELEKDLRYLELGKSEGAKLITGGERLKGGNFDLGHFISPAVFTDVTPDMRIAQEEIFGPVLSVMKAKDFDDALKKANDIEFGLSAAIITRDIGKAIQFAERVEAGVVKVNRTTTGAVANAPFGGMKKSSSDTFKEMGEEAIDFYTRLKTVYLGY
jgi:aldehyde dehydrogenase (NAD+)